MNPFYTEEIPHQAHGSAKMLPFNMTALLGSFLWNQHARQPCPTVVSEADAITQKWEQWQQLQ